MYLQFINFHIVTMVYITQFVLHRSKHFYNYCPKSSVLPILLILQCIYFYKPTAGLVLRNTEPLNIGFIFSLPYDISNTLRAPLAGPLSLILTAGLALIMFFGLLISPISYIIGYPSRNYYIHDAVKDPVWYYWGWDETRRRRRRSFSIASFSPPDSIHGHNWETFQMFENATSGTPFHKLHEDDAHVLVPPNFQQSLFSFIPSQDGMCKLLLTCHAHGFLSFTPDSVLRIYQVLSKRVPGISDEYKKAVLVGLQDQSQCSKVFNACTNDLTTMTRTTFQYVLSSFMEFQNLH